MVFGLTCWLIWKYRCKQIFQGGEAKYSEIIHQCLFNLKELTEGNKLGQQMFEFGQYRLEEENVGLASEVTMDVDAFTRGL